MVLHATLHYIPVMTCIKILYIGARCIKSMLILSQVLHLVLLHMDTSA